MTIIGVQEAAGLIEPVETRVARRHRRRLPLQVIIPGVFIFALVVVAIFAAQLAPDSPYSGSLANRLLGFGSPGHLLGTDGNGRDILSRLMWGAAPTLTEGIVPVAISGSIGAMLGMIAGLSGRRLQALIMRTLDVFYAFPSVLLAIALAAALGTGETSSIVAITVVFIAPIARVVQTEVLRFRHADFMDAATASGASRPAIIARHVVPGILPALVSYCTTMIGLAIIIAGGLSFLGLGVVPPHPEWGAMLNDLQSDLYDKPVIVLVPAVAILVTSIAFNVLGDGLRKLLDIRGDR
jgi:peptide/nickel transport system permease protein